MDLGLNEAQQMLKNSAQEFLEAECPDTYVREMEEDENGYTSEMWQKLAEQGWLGLIIPEKYGGVELEFQDLAILLEEMGRYMLPGPYFSNVVLGGMSIMDSGTEEQKQEYLPRLAEGQIIVTLALNEPSGRWDAEGIQLSATENGDDYTLNGTKLFVPNAHVSDYIVVAARTGSGENDISLFIVSSQTNGVNQTLLKTIASDRQSEVSFDNVSVSSSSLLGEKNQGWKTIEKVLKWGAIGKCAEMSGGGQSVLDMTVEYAKQRTQFGRPIGTFQAIQHHCANMATDVEGAKFITYQAAWMLSEGLPADREVAMAKAWVSDSYKRVCALGHQSHGAIGFTKEHNMQLYSRRAKAAELAFGDSDLHLDKVAEIIGL
ncbi:MAG: acyl-CoA dehydrogenase [SAR202 cluster bacterium]|jgi:alkylation response protein AidB-like acyl-CoA dehydrogenase|nr:MAG: acyl-CoA dehydrogenase [SAR202 cluster bacterium]MCH2318795.1 acyl-CoA/acyl-ACP dehydrogenase [SAR202 cluster bacterium]MQG74952.1 acyl-CoA dehydrogenase [SAR202 cluster bacterium]|tara:strand:+ start:11803 stop:12927 length:1125 start_codon:yes stop_codon:yes gene_type:complete